MTTITDIVGTDQDPAKDVDGSTLVGRHQAFKLRCSAVLHDAAHHKDWCDTFDNYLIAVGLTGRPNHGYPQTVSGETTEEEFEAWRAATTRTLHDRARLAGLGPWYVEALERAGLGGGGFETRTVQIDGTFTVRLGVEFYRGDDMITGVSESRVLSAVRMAWGTDAVSWKAIDPDAPVPADAPTNAPV